MTVLKYPRTWHMPFSPGMTNDDKKHNNPESFLGRRVIVTEKLDGGNTAIHNGVVYARSTGQPAKHQTFDYIKNVFAPVTIGMSEVFYGENLYGIHSIEYNRLTSYFYLFGIRLERHWLSFDDVVSVANECGFPVVPVVFDGVFNSLAELEKFVNDEITKPSFFGTSREGFVLRNSDGFENLSANCMKYVRQNHVQTGEHWTKNWKKAKVIKNA